MVSHSRKALSIAMITAILACDASPTDPGDHELYPRTQSSTQGSLLAGIRAATAQFHGVDAAIAAGYVAATPCLQNEGIRYRKPALIDAIIDLQQPELLIYEPRGNGGLRLIAVQYVVPSALWDAIHSSPPTLGDQPFMDRRSPPFGSPFPNYSLVVWAWKHNPSGMYELFNPAVRC